MKKKTKQEYYNPKHIHKKKRLRLWVWILFITISGIFITLSTVKILSWNKDNQETGKQLNKINKEIEIKEEEEVNTEMINAPDEKDSDYWKYIELPLISVDFDELKKENEDTVAFLKVNGTNINYPVVQTTDNDYYLYHSFDKSKNDAGWVFMDYRNSVEVLEDNTIIYAHGRYDTTMFGSLKNVFKNNWYENTDNHVLYLSTKTENTLWQVFSVYKIKTETYYLTSSFGSENSHQKFIDTLLKRSKYNFNASVDTQDKILTLSTCYNQNEKVVLHAKLIKRQKR